MSRASTVAFLLQKTIPIFAVYDEYVFSLEMCYETLLEILFSSNKTLHEKINIGRTGFMRLLNKRYYNAILFLTKFVGSIY